MSQASTPRMPSRTATSEASASSNRSGFFCIRCSAAATRAEGYTLTYRDCAMATSSASRSDLSKTGSFVRLLKSATMIQSRSWNASAGFPGNIDQGRSHNVARAAASTSASAATAGVERLGRAGCGLRRRPSASAQPPSRAGHRRATDTGEYRSFSRQRLTMCARSVGAPGRLCSSGGAVSFRIACAVSSADERLKGCVPVSNSWSSTPNAKTSERASIGWPRICSGDM